MPYAKPTYSNFIHDFNNLVIYYLSHRGLKVINCRSRKVVDEVTAKKRMEGCLTAQRRQKDLKKQTLSTQNGGFQGLQVQGKQCTTIRVQKTLSTSQIKKLLIFKKSWFVVFQIAFGDKPDLTCTCFAANLI